MKTFTATYSPDDNKLRLYASSRLDAELYARVKALGFKWAPKQEFFVAPMWTPQREDLCVELAGEIGDEDTSLTERAEGRAERFEEYQEKRAKDAEQAHTHADHISARFAGGQPILVGHHSERKARKDQEKMDNAMRRAAKLWETSAYWEYRANAALRHAKYKELPSVRARRIKKIEADKRKQERNKAEAERYLKWWSAGNLSHEQALAIANTCWLRLPRKEGDREGWQYTPTAYDALRPDAHESTLYAPRTLEEIIAHAKEAYPKAIAWAERWIAHFDNRLAYEKAMLAESGGLVSDQAKFEVGGKVLNQFNEWLPILKVNPQSCTVRGHWASTIPFDKIKGYRPPEPGDAEKIAKVFKDPPLCNYPGEGFKHMTKAEVKADRCRQWSDFPKTIRIQGTEQVGPHRVKATRGEKPWSTVGIFITDAKVTNPPPPTEAVNLPSVEKETPRPTTPYVPSEAIQKAQALKAQAEQPKEFIVAPTLYPTPLAIAERMAGLLDVQPGDRVLEPSAGTGRLLGAIGGKMFEEPKACGYKERGQIVAVELNQTASHALAREFPLTTVEQGDFLTMNGNLGDFDKIIMNPPFNQGQDIQHIEHALKFLKPGGRLVALCANGPRQQAQLKPRADYWEELPAGSFKEAGTGVNVALFVMN